MALIHLSTIHKSFSDGKLKTTHVLRGLNLEIEQGDFVAIKGASGSGKTTLLSILGTLLPPDEGSYHLDGKNLALVGTDLSLVRNRQIGFVFQNHRLMPQYTALENILLPVLAQKKQTSPEDEAYAEKLMKLTKIEGVANQYPETLSGGEASRVAVCRALIMNPTILLADEPTGQLDRENAQNIANLLVEVNRILNTTILMVTHSDETSSVAKRILTLKEGKLQ
ncbi:MAG: ABC transporter ATP-binding protein [Mangrovibacterium sp.]